MLTGKGVLVTGGTGSLGAGAASAGCSPASSARRAGSSVFSRDEAKQHDMRLALPAPARRDRRGHLPTTSSAALQFQIGDVRDYASVGVARCDGADVVFNAAAMKQVPTCEYFPSRRCARTSSAPRTSSRAIREHGLARRDGRRHLHRQGVQAGERDGHDEGDPGAHLRRRRTSTAPDTRFVCVRYGNVLASRGSVDPALPRPDPHGGPVTITTPEMTRFLLCLDEAVDTVFAALRGGAAAARRTSRACRRRGSSTSPRRSIGDRAHRDRRHRDPAGREGPRDPHLGGGGAPDASSAALLRDPADAARAAARWPRASRCFGGEYSSATSST